MTDSLVQAPAPLAHGHGSEFLLASLARPPATARREIGTHTGDHRQRAAGGTPYLCEHATPAELPLGGR